LKNEKGFKNVLNFRKYIAAMLTKKSCYIASQKENTFVSLEFTSTIFGTIFWKQKSMKLKNIISEKFIDHGECFERTLRERKLVSLHLRRIKLLSFLTSTIFVNIFLLTNEHENKKYH